MKMSDIRVSVIIPFYNRDKSLLERSVNSVLQQTNQDFECIIVDDGSSKEYASVVDEFLNVDSRIRVFHKENNGAGSSRNYGVSKSVGEYVYFLDSDDYISPYTIEVGLRIASNNQADMVVGGLIHVYENEDPGFKSKENKIEIAVNDGDKSALIMHFSGIKQPQYIMEVGSTGTSPCSRLVRRDIAKSVLFENDKFWDEDDLWNMSLVSHCKRIVIADICWYAYVINPNSMVRSFAGDRTIEFQTRAKQEYERMKDLWPECMQGAYYHIWDGLLRYCRTDTFHVDNPKSKKDKYRDFCNAIDFEEFKESMENIDFNYEKRFEFRFVKKVIKKLLLFKNKKLAYYALGACNKRIKF